MDYKMPLTLETERLNLRQLHNADWPALHQYYSDSICMKFTVGHAMNEAESWRAMAAMSGHWRLFGYGPYALELKQSGDLVGICGLWFPQDWPEPEIKWGLIRQYWGQGLAREAAMIVKQTARQHLPSLSLISLIYEGNDHSKNLALAVGARFEKTIEFRGQTALIFRHH